VPIPYAKDLDQDYLIRQVDRAALPASVLGAVHDRPARNAVPIRSSAELLDRESAHAVRFGSQTAPTNLRRP